MWVPQGWCQDRSKRGLWGYNSLQWAGTGITGTRQGNANSKCTGIFHSAAPQLLWKPGGNEELRAVWGCTWLREEHRIYLTLLQPGELGPDAPTQPLSIFVSCLISEMQTGGALLLLGNVTPRRSSLWLWRENPIFCLLRHSSVQSEDEPTLLSAAAKFCLLLDTHW